MACPNGGEAKLGHDGAAIRPARQPGPPQFNEDPAAVRAEWYAQTQVVTPKIFFPSVRAGAKSRGLAQAQVGTKQIFPSSKQG